MDKKILIYCTASVTFGYFVGTIKTRREMYKTLLNDFKEVNKELDKWIDDGIEQYFNEEKNIRF